MDLEGHAVISEEHAPPHTHPTLPVGVAASPAQGGRPSLDPGICLSNLAMEILWIPSDSWILKSP